MDDGDTLEASQEVMNGSGASGRESDEIPEKIIIGSGATSGRSSAAIEIDDMENGKDLDDEKEDEDTTESRSQNESAYRSPITSLRAQENEYEDDFDTESEDEDRGDVNRRQADGGSDDEDDEDDNIGSVSDGDVSIDNIQNGYLGLQDKERAPSSSTDELMAGYKDGGSVVSDMFSDFSGRYHSQLNTSNSDPMSSNLGSKFDRLRSAYTRPTKQKLPAHSAGLPKVQRSRPSYGYYMEPDEFKV